MVSLLRPRKSLGSLSNRDRAFPLPKGTPGKQQTSDEGRWSGENLAPSDGFSGLFASGLGFKVDREGPRMPKRRNEPPPTAFPTATVTSTATPSKSHAQPSASAAPSAFATPHRRRRSSVVHANSNAGSPAKYKSSSTDQSVDAALDGVMRSLRKMTMRHTTNTPSPIKRQQSRWSVSSDETETVSASDGLPRPSMDSVRSKISGVISIKSRKSEDKAVRPSMDELMMDLDEEAIPPVPAVPNLPPAPALAPAPTTPKRLRGLRKLLTPKKRSAAPSTTPGPVYPLPQMPTTPSASTHTKSGLPQPPVERGLPKKGSFASLRSLAKKGSATTLRSLFRDDDEPVPMPMPKHRLPQPPTTPSRHGASRPAKSSIGPPHARPAASPSKFLHELPRRAPSTPKRCSDGDQGADVEMDVESTPDLSFGGTTTPSTAKSTGTPMVFTPSFVLSDHNVNIKINANSNTDNSSRSDGKVASNKVHDKGPTSSTQSTPAMTPLTAKAQRERSRPFARPLHQLLPRGARYNNGLETPPSAAVGPASLRGLPAPVSSSDNHHERRYNPAYSIINSYSRPSLGPSNTSDAKRAMAIPQFSAPPPPSLAPPEAEAMAMPFHHGAGDGWGTPMPPPPTDSNSNTTGTATATSSSASASQKQPEQDQGYFVKSHGHDHSSGLGRGRGHGRGHGQDDAGTFGQRSIDSTSHADADKSVDVDFTASPPFADPNASFANTSIDSAWLGRPVSYASSDGVSQEWELEAYLKEVEARERRANVI